MRRKEKDDHRTTMNGKDEESNGIMLGDDNKRMVKMEIGADNDESYSTSAGGLDLRWAVALSILLLAGVAFYYYGSEVINEEIALEASFQCPPIVRHADNVDDASFEEEYIQAQKKITANMTDFLENFRNAGFDAWSHTYEEVKEGMLHWKQTYFPPNIKSGQSIYESACGIGLNLYMTLEILEEAGIKDLTVYGNEYIPFSTEKANVVYDLAPPAGSKKGKICVGDSTDLSFVPSNSFDLVYTGYISPLLDPLHFNTGDVDKNFLEYKKTCKAGRIAENWKDKKLTDLAQEKQSNFFGKWVAEMVRIAKPGSAVIIEQVSFPYCEEFWDWGGVNQQWWEPAIEKYGWDVNASSLEFEKDSIFRHRYHTFMRKNPAVL